MHVNVRTCTYTYMYLYIHLHIYTHSEFRADMNMSTRAMRTEVAYLPSYPELQYGPEGGGGSGSRDGNPAGVVATDFDLGVYWRCVGEWGSGMSKWMSG